MNTVVVAANLGCLKAFRVAETPTRGRKLELIDDVEFPEAHIRLHERLTDSAGRFKANAGMGSMGPVTAMARNEALTAEHEHQKRLIKLVADRIGTVLQQEKPEAWSFAAASEIHQAILRELPKDLRYRALRRVQSDLTKVPGNELLAYFKPAWAA
ncbi:MAG: host attachment protein [Chthoniobacteraceae bacterium]